LKDSNPIEAAEYAISNGISEEPAFSLWTRHTLCKRDRFIKKVKTGIGRRLTSSELNSPNQSKKHLRLIAERGLQSGETPLLKK
jgi:hypothetical protein